MHTRLVRVVPDEPKAIEPISEVVVAPTWRQRSWSLLNKGVLPPAFLAVKAMKTGLDWWKSNDDIDIVQVSQSSGLHDADGKTPLLNAVYAYHPDSSQVGLVVLASEFHNDMVGEQITDLVTYIRSSVRTRELRISVYSQKDAQAGIAGPVTGAKAGFNSSRGHAVEAAYDDAELVESDRPLFWISEFPEIVSLLRGKPKGRIKRTVSVDTSFGLNVSLAKHVGIDTNWIGRQCFEIEAVFV